MTAPNAPASLREDVALREALGEPHCWVVPGQDTANDYGYIDAHCCEEGELTRPLWTYDNIITALAARDAERDTLIATLRAENAQLLTDGAALAANQCEGPMVGDEHGNFYCADLAAAQARIAEMERALEAAAVRFEDIAKGRAFQPRLHAATGAEEARSAHHPEDTHDG